nr:50S ribosomal protein L24 [Promineifilum sp.]
PTGGRSRAQGGIIEFEAPIHVSKVMLVEPGNGEKTRVGVRRDKDNHVVRYSKKTGAELE